MTLSGRNQFLLLESYFSDSWWNANLLARLEKGFELQARAFPIPCRFADQAELEQLLAHYQGAVLPFFGELPTLHSVSQITGLRGTLTTLGRARYDQ